MPYFKEEDTKAAVEALQTWIKENQEAAQTLANLWKKHYLTAGHKTMARELVKKAS